MGLLLIGVAAFVVVTQSSFDTDGLSVVMPGLLAWLLALLATGLAFLMAAWRMLVYAGVLVAGGVITAWADASPGWPMLGAGIVVTITGMAMLARFVRQNPVPETA